MPATTVKTMVNNNKKQLAEQISHETGADNSRLLASVCKLLEREESSALTDNRARDEYNAAIVALRGPDLQLDDDVRWTARITAIVLFLIGSVAAAFVLIGIVSRQQGNFHGAATQQLGGYSSWDNFTANCCCSPKYNSVNVSSSLVMERWFCMNGYGVESLRVRSVNMSLSVSGTVLRPLCGMAFTAGCSLAHAASQFSLTCGSALPAHLRDLW